MADANVRRRGTGDPEATFEPSTSSPASSASAARRERPATGHGRPRSARLSQAQGRLGLVHKRRPQRTRLGHGRPRSVTCEPPAGPAGTADGAVGGDFEEKCRRRDFFADRAHNASSLDGGMSGSPPAAAGLAPRWAAAVVSGGFSSNRFPGGCGLRRGRPGKELRAGVPIRQNRFPMGGRHLSGRGGIRDSRQFFGPMSFHSHQVSSP